MLNLFAIAIGILVILVVGVLLINADAPTNILEDPVGGGGGGGGSGGGGDGGGGGRPAPSPVNLPGRVLLNLPVGDLVKPGGGVWRIQRINWKKSGLSTFQGEQVLRVFHTKGSGTSAHKGVGGMNLKAAPAGVPGDKAMVSFEVYFVPGWHFSRGGKFGGLFMGYGNASGKRHSETGSSHRIMWKKGGGAITYIYPPQNLPQEDPKLKASGAGIGYFNDIFPEGTLKIGQWNSIQIGVRMNTFTNGRPNPDGVAFLRVNGKTGTLRNIRWTRSPDLRISTFDFSTFFGGPDPAVVDCTAYYRKFQLLEWN